MDVKYCNAECQRNHWPNHKKICKQRAAELRDEALFKEPPAKEDCSICFLPMPVSVFASTSLPLATIKSVPIYDFTSANKGLPDMAMEAYYPCCGKSICVGCIHSNPNSGHCPYCRGERLGKTEEDKVDEIMKRVAVNDAGAMYALGSCYYNGKLGLLQDRTKGMELLTRAAGLGHSQAHFILGKSYRDDVGDVKKATAMAGHEVARHNLGYMEYNSGGNVERAVKHWMIAASSGDYDAMHTLTICFGNGYISRDEIDATLAVYNNTCAEMQSEGRDSYIRVKTGYNFH
jgi:TPR repeat protein